MANFVVTLKGSFDDAASRQGSAEDLPIGANGYCRIYGKRSTYKLLQSGGDAVASMGFVSYGDEDTQDGSLSRILASFQESEIGNLKRSLVGQYVLLIKKGRKLYVFSDFLGGRNVFFSAADLVVSSSFAEIENVIGAAPDDLDWHKVYEFLAVKHVLYPAWLGRGTEHKRIQWLLPYEYLVLDLESSSLQVGSVVHTLHNLKDGDIDLLSEDLLARLRSVVRRPEFQSAPVAASLSGGRDSRLVAAVAAEYFSVIRFRTAFEPGHYDSMKDLAVARKLARVRGVPLDVYRFDPNQDADRFIELTEGIAPAFNQKLAVLIDGSDKYSLGLGGVFGTELFMPLPWGSVDDFILEKTSRAKRSLSLGESFWSRFQDALSEQFRGIREHFRLSDVNDQDLIRLFILFDTARYGSFIFSAFNQVSLQFEPYGCYSVLGVALRVPSSLWGNHRTLRGDATIQKAAMARIDRRMGRILTYKNYRPMLPLAVQAFPLYAGGALLQAGDLIRRRFDKTLKIVHKTELPDGHLLTSGWEKNFLDRTLRTYGQAEQKAL